MAGNDDTVQLGFYAPWPLLGKKLSQQWGEIRTDTSHLAPLVRAAGMDADGNFSTLDDKEQVALQAWELGEDGFHNKVRHHWNKDLDRIEIQSNIPPGTTQVPNWYTVWAVDTDGVVTQIETPVNISNVGTGTGLFKSKVGVQFDFKTLLGGDHVSLASAADEVTINSTGEPNTYSSDQAAAPSGLPDTGVEIILSDSGKTGEDLPFKAIKAGPNVIVRNTGTAIEIESTSQIVEFYGIVVAHDDGSQVYPEVHNFLVNRTDFYITQQKSNPSNKTIILNSISDPFNSLDYVAVVGDDMTGQLAMHDGTTVEPSIGFTDDTTMGLYRKAADDLAFVTGGADTLRLLSDRVYIPKDLQVLADGNAAAPDIYWSTNTQTGLYQITPGDDSIAFTTGGVYAGHFDANQDLYLDNDLHVDNDIFVDKVNAETVEAGLGIFYSSLIADKFLARRHSDLNNVDFSWEEDPDTGLYRYGANTIALVTNATQRLQIGTSSIRSTLPVYLPDGAIGAPALTFTGDSTSGLWMSASQLNWSVEGDKRMSIDSLGKLEIDGSIQYGLSVASPRILCPPGSTTVPSICYNSSPYGTGLSFGTDLVQINAEQQFVGGFKNGQPSGDLTGDRPYLYMANNGQIFGGRGGSATRPSFAFFDYAATTGLYPYNGTAALGFTVAGSYAGHIDTNRRWYFNQELRAGSGSLTSVAYSFNATASNQHKLGMYRVGPDVLGFAAQGVLIGQFQALNVDTGTTPIFRSTGTIYADLTAAVDPTESHYSFGSDTTSGLHLPVAGEVAINVSNTKEMSVTASGVTATTNFLTVDEAYGVGWDENLEVPTKNAVYDKIETIAGADTIIGSASIDVKTVGSNTRIDTTGTFYTALSVEGADPTVTIGSGAALDSLVEFYDEDTLAYTMGWDESASAFKLANGIFDDTNDEIIYTPTQMIVNNEIHAEKVVAGYGIFYVALEVEGDLTMSGPTTGGATGGRLLLNPEAYKSNSAALSFVGDEDTGMYRQAADRLRFVAGGAVVQELGSTYTKFLQQALLNTGGGSATSPLLAFNSDTNTGIYQHTSGGDALDIATGGERAATFDTDGAGLTVYNDINAGKVIAGHGYFYSSSGDALNAHPFIRAGRDNGQSNFGTPQLTFDGDANARISGVGYNHANSYMFFTNNGQWKLFFSTNYAASSKQFRVYPLAITTPNWSFQSDTNSGLWSDSSGADGGELSTDRVHLVSGGVSKANVDPTGFNADQINAGRFHSGPATFYSHAGGFDEPAIRVEGGTPRILIGTAGDGQTHAASPQITFAGQETDGFGYNMGSQYPFVSVNGSRKMFWTASYNESTQRHTMAVGSAAAPGIGWSGDTTTGLYHPAAGETGFTSATNHVATFNASGLNVTEDIHAGSTVEAPRILGSTGNFYSSVVIGDGQLQTGRVNKWTLDTFIDASDSILNINPGIEAAPTGDYGTRIVLNAGVDFLPNRIQEADGAGPPDPAFFTGPTMDDTGRTYNRYSFITDETKFSPASSAAERLRMISCEWTHNKTVTTSFLNDDVCINLQPQFLQSSTSTPAAPAGVAPGHVIGISYRPTLQAHSTACGSKADAGDVYGQFAMKSAPLFNSSGTASTLEVAKQTGFFSTYNLTSGAGCTVGLLEMVDFRAATPPTWTDTDGDANTPPVRTNFLAEDDIRTPTQYGFKSTITKGAGKYAIYADGGAESRHVGDFYVQGDIQTDRLIIPNNQKYTPTNVTPDRAYDANSTTTAELADVLGTLIADLKNVGIIG